VEISSNKGSHKKVNLFFKGKELTNDEEIIGNLISNNGIEELELSVVILSLNDSTLVDENRTKEKLINKISNKCPYHENNKELFICTSCNVAFCKFCSEKHKSHEIIERKDIIKFNKELKKLNDELNKKLNDANLRNIYDLKENQNTQYNNNIEKLQNRLDNIKKIHRGIINNYKRDIDKSLPYLLEYKEKVEQLIENSYNLDTIQDDQQFIDYYFWYINIKQKQEKIENEIQELEKVQHNFDEMMNFFDEKIKNIYSISNNDYKLLKQMYYNNSIESENQLKANNHPNSNDNQIPKLNLFNLFNKAKNVNKILFTNKKAKIRNSNDLSERFSFNEDEDENSKENTPLTSRITEKFNKLENHILSKNFGYNSIFSSRKKMRGSYQFEKIEEKSEKEESLDDINSLSQKINTKRIYNINPKTKNLFYFDIKTKRIEEKKVNFENLSIDVFQESQATLNYRNNFFLSGGVNLKIFYKYDQIFNKFIKLKEMITSHSSHGMIGIDNYIFVVSGNLSKKVEKYDFVKNSWENLKELNDIRIWPSCFGFNNKYIFVFGGLKSYLDKKSLDIEKMDITSNENKWEKIKINYKNDINLPKNFGFINLRENQFLIIGGKYNSNIEDKSKIKSNYKIKISNKGVEIEKEESLILHKNEEFNGKMFNYLGEGLYGEFSSISYRTFYLINMNTKISEEIH